MAEFNNGDPKVLSLAEVREKHHKVSREELDRDLTELSFAILARQEAAEAQIAQLAQVARVQNTALLQLEARSLDGRIRRGKARLAAWWAFVGGEARAFGDHVDPPRPDLDNPEAMPKP